MIVEPQYCSEIGPMLIHFIDLALAIHMNPYESIRILHYLLNSCRTFSGSRIDGAEGGQWTLGGHLVV